jgi:predicted metal-dependent phosphoesterase TrpH
VSAAPSFDLQSHSLHSDGALPAAEVVERAAAAGVELLSLTDHDSVDGVDEALAAAGRAGIRLVAGTEITALRTATEDVHVLGYGLDRRHPALAAALADWRADRERRALAMAERLEAAGLALDRAAIERRGAAGESIGRPHLAAAALAAPAGARRLAAEGIADAGAFIERYLVPGAPGYVPRLRPTVEEAIAVVHEAGGVAVWAHPFWDVDSGEEVLAEIDRFAALGLDGVECFYPSHGAAEVALLCDRCERGGLLRTGSSDFHGPEHERFAHFLAFSLHGREPELGPIG